MPGDDWQKFANLRLLYSSMMAMPGKKLLFMGNELAPWDEWNPNYSLPWHLAGFERHQGIQTLVKDANHFYMAQPALHQTDWKHEGFQWVELNDNGNSVIAYLRKDDAGQPLLVVANHTPVVRENYRVGVPGEYTAWQEVFNSDAAVYGGSDVGNGTQPLTHEPMGAQGFEHSLSLTLPPLALVVLKPQ